MEKISTEELLEYREKLSHRLKNSRRILQNTKEKVERYRKQVHRQSIEMIALTEDLEKRRVD